MNSLVLQLSSTNSKKLDIRGILGKVYSMRIYQEERPDLTNLRKHC